MKEIRIIPGYHSGVSIRLYDTIQKKNIAKIDTHHLEQYLTQKVKGTKLEKTKRNALPIIKLEPCE